MVKKVNLKSKNLDKIKIKSIEYYLIFVLVIIDIEIFFCNASFVSNLIKGNFTSYVFSPARIFLYIILFILFVLLKKRIISNRIEYESNKVYKPLKYLIITFIIIIIIISSILLLRNNINIISLSIICVIILYLIFLLLFHSNNYKLNVFMTCFISLIFCITTDVIHPVDEMIHFTTAYNMAHGNFESKLNYSNKELEKIPGWGNFNSLSSLQVHYNKDIYLINTKSERWPVSGIKISYIPQTIGIFISEKLNGTIMDTFYFGRIFNALFLLLGIYILMKLVEYKVNCVFAILTTPYLLLLGGTYNVDCFGIITILLFCTYIINIVLDNRKTRIEKKDICILLILSLLILCFKTASYFFIFLMYLLLFKKLTKKQKTLAIIMLILLTTISIKLMLPNDVNNIADNRVNNTSFSGQLKFLLSSPLVFIKVYFLHTLNTFFNINFYQDLNPIYFFGKYSSYLTLIYFLYLVLIGISESEEKKELNIKHKITLLIITCLLFYFTSTTMYLGFTPVGEYIIKGYQARYIFPFLPLILMICNNNFIKISNNKNQQLKIYLVSLTILLLYTYCCIFSRVLIYFL